MQNLSSSLASSALTWNFQTLGLTFPLVWMKFQEHCTIHVWQGMRFPSAVIGLHFGCLVLGLPFVCCSRHNTVASKGAWKWLVEKLPMCRHCVECARQPHKEQVNLLVLFSVKSTFGHKVSIHPFFLLCSLVVSEIDLRRTRLSHLCMSVCFGVLCHFQDGKR